MALYIPHSIFHLRRLLYVRPETFGPYYVGAWTVLIRFKILLECFEHDTEPSCAIRDGNFLQDLIDSLLLE